MTSTSPRPPGGAPARITVDLDAIAANVGELKRRAGDAEVMAVVKGDAYGTAWSRAPGRRCVAARPGSAWHRWPRRSRCARPASPRRC